jgi:hypothetical protein
MIIKTHTVGLRHERCDRVNSHRCSAPSLIPLHPLSRTSCPAQSPCIRHPAFDEIVDSNGLDHDALVQRGTSSITELELFLQDVPKVQMRPWGV